MTEVATREMKARHDGGVCPMCGTLLMQGQRIALLGDRWVHTNCMLGKKAPMIGWHSGQ